MHTTTALKLYATIQTLLKGAQEKILKQDGNLKTNKLVFKSRSLGVRLNNLTREAIYED